MLRELIDAGMLLTVVAAGTGLIVLFGRDPKDAGEHSVADYRRPAARHADPEPVPVPAARRSLAVPAGPVVPVADVEVPWRPPYAELELAKVLRRYGDSPADRAARMLRSIAEEQRALVVAR